MTLTNSSIGFCTFCYKTATQTDDNKKKQNSVLCNNFYKNLNSLTQNSKLSGQVQLSSGLICCKDCEIVVSDFCENYHQIKCLELQQKWKLETLVKVMKSADKVPSRVKSVEQRFEAKTNIDINNEGQTQSLRKNQICSSREAYQLFRSLRHDVLSKCNQNISQLQPRVVLKRLRQGDKGMTNVKIEQRIDLTSETSYKFDMAIGWLMSFGAVIFLQSLYSNCRYNKRTDNYTASLDNVDTFGVCSEESFDKDDRQTIGDAITCQSNDHSDEVDFSELSRSGPDENIRIYTPQEFENDDTCKNSENNPVEKFTLKKELIFEDTTENFLENNGKVITENQPNFSCKLCSIKFTSKTSLSNHVKRKHRFIRKKLINNKVRFLCGVCKTSYKTYPVLRRHKNSATHRFLEKKLSNKKFTKIINVQSEPSLEKAVNIPESFKINKDSNEIPKYSRTVSKEVNSVRYNFRVRKKNLDSYNNDNASDLNSYEDKDYLQDTDSSYTSFSEESDLDDTNYSSSSHSENENEEKIERVRENFPPFYRCILDDCKLKRVVFYKKGSLEEHKNLHVRGEYRCNFCEKVEQTTINLSLHETEMHSAIPSTSTTIKRKDNMFYCARCPFETQKEGIYFNHFASIHLGIQTRKCLWECEICNRKFLQGKNRSKNHFKTHHDTSGLEDPDLHIKRCGESGCSAYFLSHSQLQIHKNLQHSESNKEYQLEEITNNMIETNDETQSYKCLFCMKESSKFFAIKNHVRWSHYQIMTGEEKDSFQNIKGKRHICSITKCTKSFETSKALEIHTKLHGTFACLFCEDVQSYAIDLAKHENEKHTPFIKSEDPKHKIFRNFRCSRCPRIFQHQSFYNRHFVNEHLGIETVQLICSICQFECHADSLRQHHLRNHYTFGMDPAKIQHCSICSAYFKSKFQLNLHIKKQHKDTSRMQKCAKCDEMFLNRRQLDRHLDKEHSDTNISSEFKCNKCNRFFVREQSLKVHMLYFHSEKDSSKRKDHTTYSHLCLLDRCKRRFKDSKSLELHQNLHKRGEYSCQFCDTTVNSILKLSMHEFLNHTNINSEDNKDGLHCCPRCSYKNMSAKRYQVHFAEVHMKTIVKFKRSRNEIISGKYKCQFCGLENRSAYDLGHHEADHLNSHKTSKEKGKPMIQCPRCPKSYNKLFYIKHFQKVHFNGSTKGQQTVCPICQEIASEQNRHFRKYHDTKGSVDQSDIYKCEGEDDKCKAFFLKYYQLIQHKRKMHYQPNSWTCKECGKKFKSKSTLQDHVKRLHPDILENMPFACDLGTCKRRFNTKDELNHHKKYVRHKNRNDPSIKCEKCNKEFFSQGYLQIHLKKSHLEKSFFCQECGKVFKSKGNLQMHLEYHKGPETWKFQCSTCGKKCITKYVLEQHTRTHTGEKPYICQFCGEKYAHIHNWKSHMLTKHKDQADLPQIRKTTGVNRLSRKGTKKGYCVIAEKKH